MILLADGWKTESPCEELRVDYVPSLQFVILGVVLGVVVDLIGKLTPSRRA